MQNMALNSVFIQPRVLLSKWGIVGRRLKLFIFAFFCSILLSFMYLSMYVIWPNWTDELQMNAYSTVYCNNQGSVSGKEGKLPFVKQHRYDYELLQVHMVIRHGDRAPIALNTFPNTEPVEISCLFNKSLDDFVELEKFKQHSSMFEVTGNPARVVIKERDVCKGGQLTPIGFKQHILNGKHLKNAYKGLLSTIKDTSDALVLTTDYSRTVQSAAALLYGMFSNKFFKKRFQIQVNKDQYPETHFLKDEKNEPINCPILIRRLRDVWQIDNLVQMRKLIVPVKKHLASLLDVDRDQIASLDRIIDIMYTKLCHFQKLPEGPNGKISFNLARYSFELADQLITLKHTPIAELQTLAILSRIVLQTAKFVDGTDSKRLVIFSGHDTVVVPFLAMLGTHEGKWPPYASRVVIELWHRSLSSEKRINPSDLYSRFDGYYFRLLYNGKPLTSKIKFCKDKIVDAELCPFGEFVKYVSGNEFNGDNFFQRIKNLCSVL